MSYKIIQINIWDDFLEPGDTNLYIEISVEDGDITLEDGEHVIDYCYSAIQTYLPKLDIELRHTFNELTRIAINNAMYKDIDSVIKVLHGKVYKNYLLDVVSES